MKKIALLAATVLAGLTAFAAPVLADSPGQLSNSPDNYKVRNVTQNGAYGQSTSAACNETVKYSVTLANSDYGMLTGLTLNADLPTGNIGASAKNANGDTTSVSGKVTVTTTGTLKYVAGSTVRISSDNKSTSLPDGVAGNGVNVGNLNGSTYIFVQFQAKVDCPKPPTPPKQIKVCRLSDKTIVTINESDFDAKKYSKNLDDCKVVPPAPKQIKVCRLADKTIVTINENDFDAKKYSKDLNDCKQAPPKQLKVCRLSDKTIVTINEADFDAKKYSKDLNDCKVVPPTPKQIKVCRISDKTVVTINENDFDASKYSKDLSKCETTPPAELPNTGPGQMLGVFAAVSIVGAVAHRLYSRRFFRG